MDTPAPLPPKPDLLTQVRAHIQNNPQDDLDTIDESQITRFGTVTIGTNGVSIRDFSTKNTPNEGDLPRAVIDWAIERLLAAREFFTPRPSGIDSYVSAIRHSLRSQNWFGALFLALAMPDICAVLQDPTDLKVGRR